MAAPGIPTNVLVQQGNSQVYISADLTAGATSYPVLRSTDGVTYSEIAAPASPSYLDESVTVGTLYYYKLEARNGDGDSPASSAQTVIPTPTAELSLAQIRYMTQQRADMVGSNFVSTSEWNTYINQSYFELYDLLVTLYEDYYMAVPFTFTTDGTTIQYPLPNGVLTDAVTSEAAAPFYKLLGVDLGLDQNSNAWVTLKKFDFISRNRYVYPNITSSFLGVFNLRYRLMANTIYFIPTPSAGQFVRMWYIPRLEQLLQDTDIADGISGWIEYVIVDSAIKAMQKEESDVTVLMAQKAALIKRIEDSGMNRDAGQPDTISNTRRWGDTGGGYGGPGFDGSFGGY